MDTMTAQRVGGQGRRLPLHILLELRLAEEPRITGERIGGIRERQDTKSVERVASC